MRLTYGFKRFPLKIINVRVSEEICGGYFTNLFKIFLVQGLWRLIGKILKYLILPNSQKEKGCAISMVTFD